MNCEKYRRLLIQSLRDRLTAEDQGLLSEHLSLCAACRRDQEEFETVYALTDLGNGAAMPAPERLLSRTMGILMKEEASDPAGEARILRLLVPLGAAAVLLLLLVLGIHGVRRIPGPGRTESPTARSVKAPHLERITLKEPEFELPSVSLRDVNLASFNPEGTEVHWADDFEAARSLAAYSCCPILYQVYDEECPIAEWIDCECMKNEKIVRATRNYICIRKTSKNHALHAPPKVTPAFFIICPDGEVHQEFGGMVTLDAILAELSKNSHGEHWISFQEFSDYRRMLEEALEAYRRKDFQRAQEKLDCFSKSCCCDCSLREAGIYKECQRIQAAMQAYIAAKHAHARDLVNNREIERARIYYGSLLEEFRGLPVEAILREELAAL